MAGKETAIAILRRAIERLNAHANPAEEILPYVCGEVAIDIRRAATIIEAIGICAGEAMRNAR